MRRPLTLRANAHGAAVPLQLVFALIAGVLGALSCFSPVQAQESPDYRRDSVDIYDERGGEKQWSFEYEFADLTTVLDVATGEIGRTGFRPITGFNLQRRVEKRLSLGIDYASTTYNLSFLDAILFDAVKSAATGSNGDTTASAEQVISAFELAS
ncbi:MAG: hypothetical protein K0U36_00165, partial [Alphaproteobacteria bacterium]|nr:hypothetical protein [Alphaproteobacteria bacterium]